MEVTEALKIVTKEKARIVNKIKKRRQRRRAAEFAESDPFTFQESTHILNIASCVDSIKRSFRELAKIEAKRFAISNRSRSELSGQNNGLFQ